MELKVKNPKKYSFSPIDLLADLIHIYTNLGPIEMFLKAVSFDALFDIKNIQKAHRVLKKHRRTEESMKLGVLIEQITKITDSQELNEEEQWIEEAPEDFLCPIAY